MTSFAQDPSIPEPGEGALEISQRLSRVSPLSAAKIVGVLYAAVGVLMGPALAVPMLLLGETDPGRLVLLAVAPVVYGLIGFVLSGFGAFVYNRVARWVGGLEVTWNSAPGQAY